MPEVTLGVRGPKSLFLDTRISPVEPSSPSGKRSQQSLVRKVAVDHPRVPKMGYLPKAGGGGIRRDPRRRDSVLQDQ